MPENNKPALDLHFFPGTCARVALVALEQAGLPYETTLVRLFKGEHRQPAYLALNPLGKVPTLLVDGRPLAENIGIIALLHALAPEAGLLPAPSGDAVQDAQVWADLALCSATVHPLVTRLRMPQIFAGPDHAEVVWVAADAALQQAFGAIDARLASRRWMLGEDWSVVDAFVFWLWDTALGADFDGSGLAALTAHAQATRAHPAVARALAVEGAAFGQLAGEGAPAGLPPSAKPRG